MHRINEVDLEVLEMEPPYEVCIMNNSEQMHSKPIIFNFYKKLH